MTDMSAATDPPSRRVLITGVGAAGLAIAVSACGGGGSGQSTMKTASGSSVAAADVPVGGGIYLSDVSVIVTQPSKGTFKAFSSVCTHQGCAVTEVSGTNLLCPCHGSEFNLATGAVTNGPASSPLPAKTAKVQGSNVVVS